MLRVIRPETGEEPSGSSNVVSEGFIRFFECCIRWVHQTLRSAFASLQVFGFCDISDPETGEEPSGSSSRWGSKISCGNLLFLNLPIKVSDSSEP
jgi:hypothetical protein